LHGSARISGLLAALALALLVPACSKAPITPTVGPPAVQERQVLAADVTLHVRIAGPPQVSPVLIAVHGGPGMSSGYMRSLEELAGAGLAVVTYDQRGTGRSSSPPQDPSSYTLARYAADLDAVRQAVGAEQVHVLGHSWGGVVAMRYATLYPQHVRSLVLAGSGPPHAGAKETAQENLRRRLAALQRQGLVPAELSSVGDILPAYYADPRFEPPEELQDPYYNPTVEQLTWSAVGDYDLRADVARLDCPVLLLWGREDPFGMDMAQDTRQALSSAPVDFVVLEGCGHFWQECADQFYPRVRAFLGALGAP
jgi:pimeloyl-ACP methyl ester carboxylesterase